MGDSAPETLPQDRHAAFFQRISQKASDFSRYTHSSSITLREAMAG